MGFWDFLKAVGETVGEVAGPDDKELNDWENHPCEGGGGDAPGQEFANFLRPASAEERRARVRDLETQAYQNSNPEQRAGFARVSAIYRA